MKRTVTTIDPDLLATYNAEMTATQNDYYSRCPKCRYRKPDCATTCRGCRRRERA